MASGVIIFFQKALILVFEIIVQPPKHTFEIALFFNFREMLVYKLVGGSVFFKRQNEFMIMR